MENQIRDLKDKLELFSQNAEENEEKMKILRNKTIVMDDREPKHNPRVIGNLKKKKTTGIDVIIKIFQRGEKKSMNNCTK